MQNLLFSDLALSPLRLPVSGETVWFRSGVGLDLLAVLTVTKMEIAIATIIDVNKIGS